MPRYDRTLKRLTATFAADYVRFVLRGEPFSAEPLDVAAQDRELPALSREVDFVARVRLRSGEALLLIEFQTAWALDVPRRMAGYTWRLHERYGEPVYPVVVVLRPGGSLQRAWRLRAWGRPVATCRFEVIPLWRVQAQDVVVQQLAGLYPLLPLMRWPTADPAAVLEHSQRLILEQIHGTEARADAYVALRVLSGIAYPLDLVKRILQRRQLMIESPVYREILEEGREEGQQQRLCRDVVEVLAVRFGCVPTDMVACVEQEADLGVLEALLRRAVLVESLETFAQEMAERRPGGPSQRSGGGSPPTAG
ncbi:MAG: hypothetical protein AB1505_31745 [Candidatus Latescibacterota bacterium]